jgi:hypothetical protein
MLSALTLPFDQAIERTASGIQVNNSPNNQMGVLDSSLEVLVARNMHG